MRLPVYDLKPQTESYYEAGHRADVRRRHLRATSTRGSATCGTCSTRRRSSRPRSSPCSTTRSGSRTASNCASRGARRRRRGFSRVRISQSVAGGISGGTFLFPPDAISDTSLQPEDHDQAVAINDAYTKRFGATGSSTRRLGSDYGTGYPVRVRKRHRPAHPAPHVQRRARARRRTPLLGLQPERPKRRKLPVPDQSQQRLQHHPMVAGHGNLAARDGDAISCVTSRRARYRAPVKPRLRIHPERVEGQHPGDRASTAARRDSAMRRAIPRCSGNAVALASSCPRPLG